MIRRVGDFVGRRAELRALLRDLRGDKRGVVLHGIGASAFLIVTGRWPRRSRLLWTTCCSMR